MFASYLSGSEKIRGMILTVYYGFVYNRESLPEQPQDNSFLSVEINRHLAWQNSFGEFAHEGVLPADYGYSGGYKGAKILMRMLVTVPVGAAVIYNWKYQTYRTRELWGFMADPDVVVQSPSRIQFP
jgi:hypothetical protein